MSEDTRVREHNARCVLLEAAKAIEEEKFKPAVHAAKEQLRTNIPLLHRLFPWVVTIKRR